MAALNVGSIEALFTGQASDYFATSRKVRADARNAEQALHVTGRFDADTSPLERNLARAKAMVVAATRDEAILKIDADTRKAQARIKELEGKRGTTKIDVDAEIAKAQAKIKTLESRRNAINLQVHADTAKAAAAGRKAGQVASMAAGDAIEKSRAVDSATQQVAKRANMQFRALEFGIMFAGLPAAAAVASAGAVAALASVPAAFIGIAAVALAENQQVAAAYTDLWEHIKTGTRQAAAPMAGEFIDAAGDIEASLDRMAPAFESLFAHATRQVDPLVDGVTSLAERALPGLLIAAANADPAVRGLSSLLERMGVGVADLFINLSEGAAGAEQTLDTFGGVVQDLLGFVGSLLAQLSDNGDPALQQFRTTLQQLYDTLLNLTEAGAPFYDFISGFLSVVSGGLAVVEAFSAALGSWAGPMAAVLGGAKAINMITFGGLTRGLGQARREMGRVHGASRTMRAGFSGLMSGGTAPLALASVGLGLVFDALAKKEQKAAERANEVKDAQVAFGEVLATNGGVVDAHIRTLSAQNLAADEARWAADELGISWGTVTDAAVGGADKLAALEGQLETLKQQATANGESVNVFGMELGKTHLAAMLLTDSVNQEREALAAAAAEQERARQAALNASDSYFELSDAQEGASNSARNLSEGFEVLADVAADVESKGQAIIDILAELSGRTPSAEEAMQSLNDAVRDIGEEMEKGVDKAKGWGDELLNADGTINTVTENGSKLQDFLQDAATDFGTLAKSWSEAGVPADVINERLSKQRDRLVEVMEGWGLTGTEISQVLDTAGLLPEQISMVAELTGDALSQFEAINKELLTLPDNVPVEVTALTTDAKNALLAMGNIIVQLPDGTFQIFADTSEGKAAADALVRENDGRLVTANMDLDTRPARSSLARLIGGVNASWGTATGLLDTGPARGSLRSLIRGVNASRGTGTVFGNTGPAHRAVWDWERRANGARATGSVFADIGPAIGAWDSWRPRTKFASIVAGVTGGMAKGGVLGVGNADGNQYNASFFDQPHRTMDANRASVVPPNTLTAVVPFIGDRTHDREFYIPDNKDPRSLAILREAMRSMLPDTMGMASGGMLSAAREMLNQIRRGGQFSEDFSFRGSSSNVGRHNDQLADMFYNSTRVDFGAPGTRGAVTQWLSKYVASNTPKPPSTPKPPAMRVGGPPTKGGTTGAHDCRDVVTEVRRLNSAVTGLAAAVANRPVVLRTSDNRELARATTQGQLVNRRR